MKIKAVATCPCKPWVLVPECPKCTSLGVSLVWVWERGGGKGDWVFCMGFWFGCFGFFSGLFGCFVGVFFERTLMLFEALFF